MPGVCPIEASLRQSEARYRALADAAPDAIFIVNRDSEIEFHNAAGAELFAVPREEAIGRKLHDVLPASTAAQMRRVLMQVFATGRRQSFESRYDTPRGEVWLDTCLSPMAAGERALPAVMGVARNITERKLLEQRYTQAQKMEAIGRLAGGIAHDFNNLLTAILGYSDMLLDRIGNQPLLVADVEEIKKAGGRASRLTRQLLMFSRQQVLEARILDLNEVVAELQKLLGRVIGEDVRLHVTGQAGLDQIRADPGQIGQLIPNLAVNARDAMPQGGNLRIATANSTIDDDFAQRYHDAVPGEYVSLAVADDGCGMSEDVVAHLFEPFFTTKPPGKGTGLGLSTVFGVVKEGGGFMTVDTKLGAGTTMTAYFPAVACVNGKVPAPAQARAAHGHETILIAEDEPGIRALVRRTLERYGYTVLTATSAADAMAIAESTNAEIHLLVSDVVMPHMNGPALAQRLVRRRPQLRVLYVSGFPTQVAATLGALSGRAAFLPKPFSPRALAAKVRELLDSRGNCRITAK